MPTPDASSVRAGAEPRCAARARSRSLGAARAQYSYRRQAIATARTARHTGRASLPGLYSRAELLDAMRRWSRLYGCAPVRTDWDPVRARQRCDPDLVAVKVERYRSGQWPSADSVRNRFGSFGAAIAAAGLHPRPDGVDVRWSDGAIVDALRDVAYEQAVDRGPGGGARVEALFEFGFGHRRPYAARL